MKLTKNYRNILFIILVFTITDTLSQDCTNYHKRSLCYKAAYQEGFSYYGQSASALIQKDVTLKYNAVFYGGKDYIIYMCCRPEFAPIHFTIYDSDTDELIYDNEEDDYIEMVAFSLEYTRSLEIEITALAESIDPENVYDSRSCLGVLVLWKKAPKIGF